MRGVEDYLQQIKRLEEGGQRCTATVLAQTLGVSLPSASEMLKRLAEEGYLEREKDGAIHLTTFGRPLAHQVLRRHRLVERLLTDMLGMPWHEVHREAHRLEHAVSGRVEEHLAAALGYPEYCPHGHPICPVDRRELRPLEALQAGEQAAVAQISEISEELLAYLDQIGIRPGTVLTMVEAAPFDGPLTFEAPAAESAAGGAQTGQSSGLVTVGREVAGHVRVCDPSQSDWINRRATAIAARFN